MHGINICMFNIWWCDYFQDSFLLFALSTTQRFRRGQSTLTSPYWNHVVTSSTASWMHTYIHKCSFSDKNKSRQRRATEHTRLITWSLAPRAEHVCPFLLQPTPISSPRASHWPTVVTLPMLQYHNNWVCCGSHHTTLHQSTVPTCSAELDVTYYGYKIWKLHHCCYMILWFYTYSALVVYIQKTTKHIYLLLLFCFIPCFGLHKMLRAFAEVACNWQREGTKSQRNNFKPIRLCMWLFFAPKIYSVACTLVPPNSIH